MYILGEGKKIKEGRRRKMDREGKLVGPMLLYC